MKMNQILRTVVAAVLLTLCVFSAGCNNNAPPLSKQEQNNFNPGPPPANVDIGAWQRAHSGKNAAPGAPGGQPTADSSKPQTGQGAPQ